MNLLKCLILSFSLALSVAARAADEFKPGTYQIDASHSKVGFEIPHLVISTVEGRFTKFEGTIVLATPFEKSTVKAVVDISSVDTSNAKRDDHLRSPDFFDATKFPKMTFDSKSITGTPQAFKLTGTLNIKGTARPVTFDAKYLGTVADGYGNEKAAFAATATIKRSDFGLAWSKMVEAGPVVGDSLTIQLKIQAAKPAAAAKK